MTRATLAPLAPLAVFTPDAHDAALANEAAMLAVHLDDAARLTDVDLASDAAISVYLTAKRLGEAAALPYAQLADRARGFLRHLVETTGQLRFVASAGECYLPAPSTRVTYDAKALDALCARDEDAARLLRPHRRETAVAGSLTIRAGR